MTPRIKLPDDGGFKIYMYLGDREHGVPHAHAYTNEGSVVIALGDETTKPYMLESSLRSKDERKALRLIASHQERLLAVWREHHG